MNVQPKADWTLYPDGWAPSSTYLMPSDWDKAQWRVPSANYPSQSSAINLRVTGRKVVKKFGNYCVRVEITWVGDGEPDTYSYGYLAVNVADVQD